MAEHQVEQMSVRERRMKRRLVDGILAVALGCVLIATAIIVVGTRRASDRHLVPDRLDPKSREVRDQRLQATEGLLEGDALSADPR